jgi:misacylated tRNA(Ala) deacylase
MKENIMTKLLYQTDSQMRDFTATVTAIDVEQNALALDQTAFFPGGGGQPNDTGMLTSIEQTWPVRKVKRAGSQVWHCVESDLPPVDTQLTGVIDWDRRYKLMRIHTALHILCGVIWRDYGASVTGGNMEPGKARMDFEFERMQRELVAEIEDKINVEVEAARAVKVSILPREEAFEIPDLIRTKINLLPKGITEVRTVEIEGLDLQADGGTHVTNTSMVGRINIVDYKSKGRINKRLVIELDKQ